MKVLVSILAIVLMIIIHEWGHFIAGRICKVPVFEFSIGFGPKIFSKKGKKETTYSVRCIPLGGFCAFDENDNTGNVDSNLNKQPLYKRMFIFFAGPLMNVLSAFIVLFFIYAAIGLPVITTTVADIYDEYEAKEVLEIDDTIIMANGENVKDNSVALATVVSESNGEPIELLIDRNGEELTISVTPKYDEESQRYFIGIIQKQRNEKVPIIQSISYSAQTIVEYGKQIYTALFNLITGKTSVNQMSSIVGIVDVMTEYASTSNISIYLTLCAYISFNLGLMNLLPIPGLDGSKILFGIIEGITRKRVSEKVEYYLTLTCMGLIILLSGYLIFHDTLNIIFS